MEYEIEYERIDQNKTEQNKTEQRSQCSTMTDNTKETKNKIKQSFMYCMKYNIKDWNR